jgi:hypothetical protein
MATTIIDRKQVRTAADLLHAVHMLTAGLDPHTVYLTNSDFGVDRVSLRESTLTDGSKAHDLCFDSVENDD